MDAPPSQDNVLRWKLFPGRERSPDGTKSPHQFMRMPAFPLKGTEIWPYLGGRLFWDFDNPGMLEIDGGTVSADEVRAAVSVGVDVGTQDTQINIEVTYDGLFTDDYEWIGGRLAIGHRF